MSKTRHGPTLDEYSAMHTEFIAKFRESMPDATAHRVVIDYWPAAMAHRAAGLPGPCTTDGYTWFVRVTAQEPPAGDAFEEGDAHADPRVAFERALARLPQCRADVREIRRLSVLHGW